MQHPRSRDPLLMDGSLHRVGIDDLPLDGIGEPGRWKPGHFKQVTLQLTLVHFWSARILHRESRPELDTHSAMSIGEPVRSRDRNEWKRPDHSVPEKGGGSRRDVLFRNHREPLLARLHPHESVLYETHRADRCFAH